jgi:hypothetical protein
LVRLHLQRWEIELGFRQIKPSLQDSQVVLLGKLLGFLKAFSCAVSACVKAW